MKPQEHAENIWNAFASIFKGMDKKNVYVLTKKAALMHMHFLLEYEYKSADAKEYFQQVQKCINLM